MADIIERQAAIDAIVKQTHLPWEDLRTLYPMLEVLEQIPSAEPERKTGRWIDTEPNIPDGSYKKSGMAYYCSCCKHLAGKYKHKTYRFCPWCGAEMTEGENETD